MPPIALIRQYLTLKNITTVEPPAGERHLTTDEIRQIANLMEVEFSPEEIKDGEIVDDQLNAIVAGILQNYDAYHITAQWVILPERDFVASLEYYFVDAMDHATLGMINSWILSEATGWPSTLISRMQEHEEYEILGECMDDTAKAAVARRIARGNCEAELLASYDNVRRVLRFNDTVGAYYFYKNW